MLAKAYWEDRANDPVVKYSPGDEIPGDHPKRGWLLRSGIAVEAEPVAAEPSEGVDVAEADDDEVSEESPEPEKDEDSDVAEVSGKPKPTASVADLRAYAEKHGVAVKGLSRPQLVKAINDL